MDMQKIVNNVGKAIDRNAPTLLAVGGVIAMMAATVIAVIKTPEAIKRLEVKGLSPKDIKEKGKTKEVLKTTVPVYAPVIALEVAGATSVIAGGIKSTSTITGMAATIDMLDRSLTSIKSELPLVVGEKKASEVEEAVARTQCADVPSNVIIPKTFDGANTLFHDLKIRMWFYSDLDHVKRALSSLDCLMRRNDGECSLNEYLTELGLDTKIGYNRIGFKARNYPLSSEMSGTDITDAVHIIPVLSSDGINIFSLNYDVYDFDKERIL